MPPPIMAMRFMKSRATPAKPELAESPNEAEREAEGMLVLQSQAFSKNCDKLDRVKSARLTRRPAVDYDVASVVGLPPNDAHPITDNI